jgi:hypothetical protein
MRPWRTSADASPRNGGHEIVARILADVDNPEGRPVISTG